MNQTGEITIIYEITDQNLRIFGNQFANNNMDRCQIELDGQNRQLTVFLDVGNRTGKLTIKLKGINLVTNMSYLFDRCTALISLPDIENWNTSNITDMSFAFSGCSSLKSFDGISQWNTEKVTNMSHMFNECSSLQILPNISNWNTKNVTDMSYMFNKCNSIIFLFGKQIVLWV